MKKLFFPILFAFLWFSCTENLQKNDDSQQKTEVEKKLDSSTAKKENFLSFEIAKPAKKNYISSEKIKISVKLEKKEYSFDSLQFCVDNQRVTSTKKLPFNFFWDTRKSSVGKKKISLILFSQGKKSEQDTEISLFSDVLPLIQKYKIVKTFPHDEAAFTQGLFYDKGFLYEATGMEGESTLRKVKFETGEILQSFTVHGNEFGEGIALFENKIIQITWQSNVGYVYEKENFKQLQKFTYNHEGWGITTDGKNLFVSDGTHKIHVLEPQTFSEVGIIEVFDHREAVQKLNELEFIEGEIFANIWQTEKIARIDVKTGKVIAYIDLKGILPESDRTEKTDVLNGIAYDSATKRIFVTGKRWKKLFEIKIF